MEAAEAVPLAARDWTRSGSYACRTLGGVSRGRSTSNQAPSLWASVAGRRAAGGGIIVPSAREHRKSVSFCPQVAASISVPQTAVMIGLNKLRPECTPQGGGSFWACRGRIRRRRGGANHTTNLFFTIGSLLLVARRRITVHGWGVRLVSRPPQNHSDACSCRSLRQAEKVRGVTCRALPRTKSGRNLRRGLAGNLAHKDEI